MIRLSKGPTPPSLTSNKTKWTQILTDHDIAGTNPSKAELNRYNNIEIKTALKIETNFKCAYCESKFEHVAFGDIEHIVPKKKGHQYRLDWNNLTIACQVCNNGKSDRDGIVDPYQSDPESKFFFEGPIMFPVVGDQQAFDTWKFLGLFRPSLVERRQERLKYITSIISQALTLGDGVTKDAILQDLKAHELIDEKEFAAMSRSFHASLESKSII